MEKDTDFCLEKAETILDEQGQKSGWYKQIVAKVDNINGNNNLYPKQVYQDALEELKKQGFPYAGEHPHPTPYRGADGKIALVNKNWTLKLYFRHKICGYYTVAYASLYCMGVRYPSEYAGRSSLKYLI